MFVTAIVFILILSLLVFIHEFGHYCAARIVGVTVEEFGFGLPPRIFGKKIKGTIYSVNALPIGGFVKLKGEDDENGGKSDVKGQARKTFFWARNKKERAFILLAGVTMNFLLAWGITTFLLTQGIIESTGHVKIQTVSVGSPAELAGLKVGDRIDKVSYVGSNGVLTASKISTPTELINLVKDKSGSMISIFIFRDNQSFSLGVVPRVEPPPGEGPLGISISDLERRKYSLVQAPVKGLTLTFTRAWQMTSSLGNLLFRLVTAQKIDKAEISGPVGIAAVTGEAVKYGWEAVLEFMSILSLNLALLNVLPFPALDGGRLAFIVLEKLGKKARPDIERIIHQMGMIFLLALIALITFNDILRLAGK